MDLMILGSKHVTQIIGIIRDDCVNVWDIHTSNFNKYIPVHLL